MSKSIIIPDEKRLRPEGLYLGQLVCPKAGYVAKWNIARFVSFGPSPVLNLIDMQTGVEYEDSSKYVDFLASCPIMENDCLVSGQLVCSVYPEGLNIGTINGLCMAGDEKKKGKYVVFFCGAKKSVHLRREQLLKVVRVESSF